MLLKILVVNWIRFGKRVIKLLNHIIIGFMNLKYIALQLCTCTWIEIMTCIGIASYMVYLHNYRLAAITLIVFAPLIGFHFAISKLSKAEDCDMGKCHRIESY